MTIKEIEKKALELNALDKIYLVEKLLCSLDKGGRSTTSIENKG